MGQTDGQTDGRVATLLNGSVRAGHKQRTDATCVGCELAGHLANGAELSGDQLAAHSPRGAINTARKRHNVPAGAMAIHHHNWQAVIPGHRHLKLSTGAGTGPADPAAINPLPFSCPFPFPTLLFRLPFPPFPLEVGPLFDCG